MKNINLSHLILMAIWCSTLSSCTHYYYAPDEGALAALEEKNDLRFSYGANGGEEDKNRSFQVAYSPIKHIGLQASYFSGYGEGLKDDIKEYGDGFIKNAAIGGYYFFPHDKRNNKAERIPDAIGLSRGLLLDLYGGYSEGTVNNYYVKPTSSHFNFSKKYLQLGLHWKGRIIGVNYVTKFGVLDFRNGVVNGRVIEEHLDDIDAVRAFDTYNFMESSIRFHFGIRHIRFFITTTWLNTSNMSKVQFIDNTVHLGVLVEIDELFRKKERPKDF